jgi:2Fe-2S ferredoxin
MKLKTKDICIKVLTGDEELQLQTYTHEYRNLMMLLFDKIYLEDFGECKGMGKCCTCMIEVVESENEISSLGRNEQASLQKSGMTDSKQRLSCQILVSEELHNATIKIIK